jgi:hypothetical protein
VRCLVSRVTVGCQPPRFAGDCNTRGPWHEGSIKPIKPHHHSPVIFPVILTSEAFSRRVATLWANQRCIFLQPFGDSSRRVQWSPETHRRTIQFMALCCNESQRSPLPSRVWLRSATPTRPALGPVTVSDLSFQEAKAAVSHQIRTNTRLTLTRYPEEDYACSRYDHAYPNLVHQDEQLGDPTARKFQFKSCSGALTTEVLSDQIPALDANQQVILLSIGKWNLTPIKL